MLRDANRSDPDNFVKASLRLCDILFLVKILKRWGIKMSLFDSQ